MLLNLENLEECVVSFVNSEDSASLLHCITSIYVP